MTTASQRLSRLTTALALTIGAAAIATSDTAQAIPVVPDTIAEDPAFSSMFWFVDSDGQLVYLSASGDLVRYDADSGTDQTLASGVIRKSEQLPRRVTVFDESGPNSSYVLYRGDGNSLMRLDLQTGLKVAIASLGADSFVRTLTTNFDGKVYVAHIDTSTTDDVQQLLSFELGAASPVASSDSFVWTGQLPLRRTDDDRWMYRKGQDDATEIWAIGVDGATPLAGAPDAEAFSPISGEPVLWYRTRTAGFPTEFVYWIVESEGDIPREFFRVPIGEFPFIIAESRVAVFSFNGVVMSLDNAFAPWSPPMPTIPDGFNDASFSGSYDDESDRIVVRWTFRNGGLTQNGPRTSYDFDGTSPVELEPFPEREPFDPLRRELSYGGVLQIVDNSDGTFSLTYTPARSDVPRVIDTASTAIWPLNTEDGSARTTFVREDGTFVSYALEQDEATEVTLESESGRISTTRLGRDSNKLLLARTCFGAPCPTAGLYIVESPSYAPPFTLQSIAPARLLDTRAAGDTVDGESQRGGRVAAGSVTEFSIRERGGVPPLADTTMLNITAVDPSGKGFLTVYACDVSPRPSASNVNYEAGRNVANAVLAEASDDGRVCVYSSAETHLIADVNGYVIRGASARAVTPARFLDTRASGETFDSLQAAGGRVSAGETIEIDVTDRGDVAEFTPSVLLNITAVNPSARGFLTVFPCGEDLPTASNVNYEAGKNVANAVLARPGLDGRVCVYSSAATDVIADVNGVDTRSNTTYSLVPARLLDTRASADTVDGSQQAIGRVDAASITAVNIRGRGGVDVDAPTVMLNVTAVNPGAKGFLTVFQCDIDRPGASNVNFERGQNVPNAVLAKVAANGTVCVYSSVATDLIVDVNAWIAAG